MTKTQDATLAINSARLAEGLSVVIPSAGRDQARPILRAVCFEITTRKGSTSLRLVAADNFRLSWYDVGTTSSADINDGNLFVMGEPRSFVLPLDDALAIARNLKETKKAWPQYPTIITWPAENTKLLFIDIGSMRWVVTPIDGVYPNYAAILPKGKPASIMAVDPALLASLAGSLPGAREGRNPPTLILEYRKPISGIGGLSMPRAVGLRINGKDDRGAMLMPVRIGT